MPAAKVKGFPSFFFSSLLWDKDYMMRQHINYRADKSDKRQLNKVSQKGNLRFLCFMFISTFNSVIK